MCCAKKVVVVLVVVVDVVAVVLVLVLVFALDHALCIHNCTLKSGYALTEHCVTN